MATIKSFTSLEQSRKLAEILPIESADMRYGYIAPYNYSDRMYDGGYDEIPYPKDFLIKNPNFSANEYDAELPCWSLASLLSVLPAECECMSLEHINYGNNHKKYFMSYVGGGNTDIYDNPVDACVAMIEKLHELKML